MFCLPALALAACLVQQGTPVPIQDYEVLITGLTQETSWLDFKDIGYGDPDHKYKSVMKLVDAGFISVPFLLDHIHDGRKTGAMLKEKGPCTVGDFCAGLLLGYQDGIAGVFPPSLGGPDPSTQLAAWWPNTKKQGEQDYAYKTVISAAHTPAPILVRLLQIHYPFIVPSADEALAVRDPGADTVQLIKLAGSMGFSDQTMIRLCLRNTQGTDPASVYAAMLELEKADKSRFEAKLIELLDKSSTPLAYVTGSQFAGDLAKLASLTGSPEVWSDLAKAAKRAKSEDREAMIVSVNYEAPPGFRHRIVQNFLSEFITDSRVLPSGWQTNDLVASEIGVMRHMKVPAKDAPRAQWAIFRDRIAWDTLGRT